MEDRVDVGFKIGRSVEEGVIASRLFTLQLIIRAAPAYIARHSAPEHHNALAAHRYSAFCQPVTGRMLHWYLEDGDGLLTKPSPASVGEGTGAQSAVPAHTYAYNAGAPSD